jgi:hypothetical protein
LTAFVGDELVGTGRQGELGIPGKEGLDTAGPWSDDDLDV